MSDAVTAAPRLPAIVALFLLLGGLLAVVQPLGHLPDEAAHQQYIEFLATRRRLPLWQPTGGEAGYEAQHPPLSYLLYAPAHALLAGGGPVVLNQGLRGVSLLVGLVWILLAAGLFRRVFGEGDPRWRWATASLAWLPLVLLYADYPNPDLVVALLATVALGLAWRQVEEGADRRRAAWLGAALAAVFLTKLSGLAVWLLPLAANLLAVRRGRSWRSELPAAALTYAVAGLLIAPYVARSYALYGRPVIKTVAPYGSALQWVEQGLRTGPELLFMTLRNTWLSTWIQPDWLPGWPLSGGHADNLPIFPVLLFYGLLTALVGAGLLGLRRGLEPRVASFLGLGAVLLAGVFVGQQAAFWTQDVEFNMGGRYLLAGLPALLAAIVAGLARPGDERWLKVWLGLLVVMNCVGAVTIVGWLNPHYHPGWRPFQAP